MRDIGCIIFILRGGIHNIAGHVHHIVKGHKRLGHDYTLYLHPWYHVGLPPEGWTIEKATQELGPSFALNKKAFIAEFGTEEALLEFQNALLDHYVECERQDED